MVLVVEHVRDITDRQLAEEALKESEGRFRTLIEDSPESLFLTDVQGTVLAASRVAAQRLGKELPEVIGRSAFEHLSPEVASRRRALFEQVIATGRPVRLEDARDDRHFDIHINPILDADGKVSRLSILAIDITDRKNAEQALKEKTRLNQILLDAFPCVALLLRPGTREIVASNAEAVKVGALPGTQCFRTWGQRQDPCPWCLAPAAWATGEAQHLEVEAQGIFWEAHWIPVAEDLYMHFAFDVTARKQAEAALRESEELYRSLFENMLNGFAYCKMLFDHDQPQDFIYLDVNRSFEVLTGLKNVVGKKVSEVIPGLRESDPELLEIYGRVALTGEPERFETYVEALKMWFSVSVYSPAREYFVVVFDVITARKQAEAALRESEARFRHISSTISDISYSCSTGPDGSYAIDWLAGAAERITGYSVEEIKAQGCWEFLVIEADQPLFERHITGLAAGSSGTCELRLRHKNGGIVWVASFAKIVQEPEQPRLLHIYGGLVDITARKQAEEALAAHLQFLQLLLDTIPNPIFFKDAQGAYLGCNKAFEDFLGVTRQEIVGKSVYDLSPKELADEYHRMDLEAFQTTGTQVYESRVQAADGAQRHVVFHKATFPDPTGGVGGLVGIITDITGLKQAEAELRQSEQRFRLMAETIQDVFWIATPDIGKMVYVSPGYEQVWGRTCQELYQSPQAFLESHPSGGSGASEVRDCRGQGARSSLEPRIPDYPTRRGGALDSGPGVSGPGRPGPRHPVYRGGDGYHRAQGPGGAAPPGSEDGSGGPAGRGGGPRFQQSPDGHHGLRRTHAGQDPQG